LNYKEIRTFFLKAFIAFLGLTALVAIICVLSGDFGDLQVKILATSFTISAASICSMSCAAFIEKRKATVIGLIGILLSAAAAVMVFILIWAELNNNTQYRKFLVTLVVLAIAHAHAFLLLLPELGDSRKWIQNASSVSIGTLALLIVVAVWGEIEAEAYYRILSAVAIIVGLETLVVPILMKLARQDGQKGERLVLEKVEGNVYRGPSGKNYRVDEI